MIFDVIGSFKWFHLFHLLILSTGELVFRLPFGMTNRGSDETLVAKCPDQVMASHEPSLTKIEHDSVRAVQMMNERSALMVSLGMLPKYWRPLIERIPMEWIRRGNAGVEKMSSLVMTAIADGSKNPSQRNDILSKYFDATDEDGRKMGLSELYTEALVLLAAGADTTAQYVGQNCIHFHSELTPSQFLGSTHILPGTVPSCANKAPGRIG